MGKYNVPKPSFLSCAASTCHLLYAGTCRVDRAVEHITPCLVSADGSALHGLTALEQVAVTSDFEWHLPVWMTGLAGLKHVSSLVLSGFEDVSVASKPFMIIMAI